MVTGDPATLWLVIVGSAVTTGSLLWLVKVLVDEDPTTRDQADDKDKGKDEDQVEEPQLKWVLVRTTTGEPLHTLPDCQPTPRPALSAGEPLLPITTPEPPHGRHRKGHHRCI
ncbi:hypothetical protein [Streptomyces ossamyceticus]|uniref:hypothetical protein n=1 Tax=Streptomyces ossamyceticus TaxID=249581 RepID=UPI003446C7CF